MKALVSKKRGALWISQELYPGTPNSPAVAFAPDTPFVVMRAGGSEVTAGVFAAAVEGCGKMTGAKVEFVTRGNIFLGVGPTITASG